jgi:hypothetical protein
VVTWRQCGPVEGGWCAHTDWRYAARYENVLPVRYASMINTQSPKADLFIYLCYKVSAYVVLNLGEDAALVALMFC